VKFSSTAQRLGAGAALLVSAVLLSACGERQQTQGGLTGAKRDLAPSAGTESTAYKSGDWKAGDRNAWAQHLKARAQNSQSDYQRVAN
jgi:major membrane immunogen (membrane-anchored lipoprotein)